MTRPLRLSSLLPPCFRLLSGDDATAQAFISIRGDGCISKTSNVTPDLCRTIFSNLKPGRQQIARALQRRVAPLEYCPFNESPAAVKYALSLLGLMDPGTPLPIVQLDSPEKAAIAKAVAGIDDNLHPEGGRITAAARHLVYRGQDRPAGGRDWSPPRSLISF